MYEKILVPLDGSDLCELVLPYVEELGERLGSEIILLHVCPPKLGPYSHKHEVYIEQMAQVVKDQLKGEGRVEAVLLAGEANKEIIDYAKREDIGLIAMMTHGQSGVKRWILGSTADKVARETSKPVLLIRAGVPPAMREERKLNKLLIPLDGSKESEVILPYVEELVLEVTTEPKPEVILLQVIASTHYVSAEEAVTKVSYSEAEIEQLKAEAKAYLEKAGSELKSKGITVKYEEAVGNDAEEIINFADKINADLTAMSTHGYSGFSRLFLGSVADRVLHHGNTPLLLVKPTKASEPFS